MDQATKKDNPFLSQSVQFLLVHGLVVLISLGLVAAGLALALHSVPDTSCVGSTKGGDADRNDINKWALIIGMPAIVGGVFSIFGGMFGTGFAWKKNECLAKVAMVLIGIAMALVFTSMASGVLANFHGCGDYRCNGPLCSRSEVLEGESRRRLVPEDWAGEIAESGTLVCNNETVCKFEFICKAEYDSFCEYDKKALPLFFVSFAAVVFMCCGCCQQCCVVRWCPEAEMDETPRKAGIGQDVVVGQPRPLAIAS